MILVTGATGFVGQRIVARLVASGREVCCLVRPARKERRFLPGIPVQIIAGSVDDPHMLRMAMREAETVVHLATLHFESGRRTFESVNYQGTLNVVEAARQAGVKRLIYLSQPGADRNSAYPFLRSIGMAEEAILESGLDYTILSTSRLYGKDDDWTTNMAMVLKSIPLVFPVVGNGQARFQPLWVEDLARCADQCVDDPDLSKRKLAIGGPEYFTLDQVADILARVLNVRRRKIHLSVPMALWLARTMERTTARPLLTQAMIDGLNVDLAADLVAIRRHFGFEPARFAETVAYLRGHRWQREFVRRLFVRV